MPKPESMIGMLGRGILDLAYPPACHVCEGGQPAVTAEPICRDCLNQIKQLGTAACPRCGVHFPQVHSGATDCAYCHDQVFAFTQAVSLGNYELILRQLVLKLKHLHHESLAYHLGRLSARQMQPALSLMPIDVIVPVPLHWTRLIWRGYNQSAVLASAFAAEWSKPVCHSWLWRRLRTPQQASVTPAARRRNLRQAMAARIPSPFRGQHVLLIDDVMTTGATADACARALLAAGAGSVRVATLARATGETAK